jgi:hypothetical protein
VSALKNCGVIYARLKQQREARGTVNNETPERRAVNWIEWWFWPSVRQARDQLTSGPKENGLSLERHWFWNRSDQKAPCNGTIQKRNLTSRAQPAKTGIIKDFRTMLFQSSDSTLKKWPLQLPLIVVKGLLSLARFFGGNRQYGLPKS